VHKEPERGCACGGEWVREGECEIFQVIDLPPKLTPEVTNFLISTYRCSGCKATHKPGYQPTLRYSPYGPRLHAFVSERGEREAPPRLWASRELYCPRVSWTSDLINRPRVVTQESGAER